MNFKKFLSAAAAVVICLTNVFCPLTDNADMAVNAESYSDEMQYDDYLYYKKVDEDDDGIYDYIKITDCDESAINIDIPTEIDDLSVKEIGKWSIGWCENLTNVTIPDSVILIGDYAFNFCSKLTNINIPDSVIHIGEEAFGGCAFKSITIPNNVIEIGSNVFVGCNNLEDIYVSEDNQNYLSDNGVLFNKDKTALLRYPLGKTIYEYSIPDSVTSIENGAFSDCNLKKITIPDGVENIGDYAFAVAKNLKSVEIPDSVTYMGKCVFNVCSNLKSVKIGKGITSIQMGAFFECSSLESISIPDNVTHIGAQAFQGCTSLKSITIGKSITSIQTGAFFECSSLESISIPDNVTYIGVQAFQSCTSLTSITIGNSVTSIEKETFKNCTSLESISIPDNVTYIGVQAFQGCTSLTSITIGNSVTSIEKETFKNCTSLESISIPDNVTYIGVQAFQSCTSLTSITIGNSVTSIGKEAFYNTALLKNQIGIKYVDKWVVDCDNDIINADIKEGIEGIADYAFCPDYGIESCLTNATIPDSVVYVGINSFKDTPLLNNQTGVKYVDKWVVDCDNDVINADIEEGIEGIADYAFNGCDSLEKIIIPKNIKTIGTAFYNLKKLKIITIENPECKIYDNSATICNYNKLYECYYTGVIRGYKNSTAQEYAEKYNYKFETIDEPIVTTVVTIEPAITTTTKPYNYLSYVEVDKDEDGTYDCVRILDYDKSMISVEIPAEINGLPVTEILDHVFCGCNSLENINVSKNNKSFTSEDGILFNKDKTELISYPAGKKNSEYVIPDSVTSIAPYAFENCSNLTNATIPNSVSSMSFAIFLRCYNLTNVTISDGVPYIGDGAFFGCSGLTNITIPKSVEFIESQAFANCSSLESITIKNPKCDIHWYDTICNEFDSDKSDKVYYNGIIYGYKDSTAQKYAEVCGYTFEAIDEEPIVTTISVTSEPPESSTTATTVSTANTTENSTSKPVTTVTANSDKPVTTESGTASLPYNISLSETEVDLEVGDSVKLIVEYFDGEVKWFSDDTSIATVKDGKITAVSPGTVEIYAMTSAGNLTCTVNVIGAADAIGDISGNGATDLYDAIEIAMYMVGKRTFTEAEMKIADVNNDGAVNLYDAIRIAEIMVENTKK
ncbi:MAG: leucine-rich repeat protein [Clostridium sp.]|nr:leucine-rich repeat protein [Clostridium sp.]MCM1547393.1 leucine-rich repeat protein [Ruminococcus sp.]